MEISWNFVSQKKWEPCFITKLALNENAITAKSMCFKLLEFKKNISLFNCHVSWSLPSVFIKIHLIHQNAKFRISRSAQGGGGGRGGWGGNQLPYFPQNYPEKKIYIKSYAYRKAVLGPLTHQLRFYMVRESGRSKYKGSLFVFACRSQSYLNMCILVDYISHCN